MPYTLREQKNYPVSPPLVRDAVAGAVAGLDGKIVAEDATTGKLVAQFKKSIHGKVLGERTQLSVSVEGSSTGGSQIHIEAYPLDAVGKKLMFGARKGVTRTLLDWFYAHLEHRLR